MDAGYAAGVTDQEERDGRVELVSIRKATRLIKKSLPILIVYSWPLADEVT